MNLARTASDSSTNSLESYGGFCIPTDRPRSFTEGLIEAGCILPMRTLSSSTSTSVSLNKVRRRSFTEGLIEAGCILPNPSLSSMVYMLPSPTPTSAAAVSIASSRTNSGNTYPYHQLGPQTVPILRYEPDLSFADQFFAKDEASTKQTAAASPRIAGGGSTSLSVSFADGKAAASDAPFAKRIRLLQEEPSVATSEPNIFSNSSAVVELTRTRSDESDSSYRSYFSNLSNTSLDLSDIFHGKGKTIPTNK
jgi:hypothetical protein